MADQYRSSDLAREFLGMSPSRSELWTNRGASITDPVAQLCRRHPRSRAYPRFQTGLITGLARHHPGGIAVDLGEANACGRPVHVPVPASTAAVPRQPM
jgi:hypothetical protein